MVKNFLAVNNSLAIASNFIEEELKNENCDSKPLKQILISFEEIFVNIIHYAYPNEIGNIEVEITIQNGIAKITFIDEGIPFNPLIKDDPDITLSVDEREIGGLRNFYC